jgi:hypothetical protein
VAVAATANNADDEDDAHLKKLLADATGSGHRAQE